MEAEARQSAAEMSRLEASIRDLAAANEALTKEITERKRAEETLRQEERDLRRIIDAIPHFITVLGPDGRTLDANAAVLANPLRPMTAP